MVVSQLQPPEVLHLKIAKCHQQNTWKVLPVLIIRRDHAQKHMLRKQKNIGLFQSPGTCLLHWSSNSHWEEPRLGTWNEFEGCTDQHKSSALGPLFWKNMSNKEQPLTIYWHLLGWIWSTSNLDQFSRNFHTQFYIYIYSTHYICLMIFWSFPSGRQTLLAGWLSHLITH